MIFLRTFSPIFAPFKAYNLKTHMFKLAEGKTYPKITQSRAIIRFQDCDPFQHLNNTNYFNYFFNAREDQVGHLYDFNVSELYKEYHTGWVVYNHQIAIENFVVDDHEVYRYENRRENPTPRKSNTVSQSNFAR